MTKQKTVTKTSTAVLIGATEITLDISGRSFSDILPFDIPFILAGTQGVNSKITLDKIISIECFYKVRKDIKNNEKFPDPSEQKRYQDWEDGRMYAFWENNGSDAKWRLSIKELPPNRNFSFFFKFKRKLSDDEKTKLVNHAVKIIPKLINQKADNSVVSLSIKDMDEIMYATINQLNVDLMGSGQEIDEIALSEMNRKIVLKAMEEVAFAFEERIDEQESISMNFDALKGDSTALAKFLSGYKTSADKNAGNVSAMNNVVNSLKSIFSYPKGENAINPENAKNYLNQIEYVKAELEKAQFQDGSPFNNIKNTFIGHLEDLARNFNEYIESINNTITITNTETNNFITAVVNSFEDEIIVNSSTINHNFVTRSNSFITADIGVALMPSIAKMVPYLGTNIYLRPINQDRPLFMKDLFKLRDFDRRFSLMLGLTYITLKKDGYRDDLMGTFNLITGAGIRIADFVKVNGGVIWHTRLNPNPLNTNNTVRGLGFVSLSIDLQINTVFNKLFGANVITLPTKP
ncbi:hypothetical protein HQN84_30055 [Pedobacter steynii]|uniref:hypothetical protein n=1 Tax=Pedobacter steynii TaxID=430522 RepID=UPI00115FF8F1|nr:hypothetical protein [Pedobacter steynii]NQX43131.1 hypothetical protein [Pedobacter steynii]